MIRNILLKWRKDYKKRIFLVNGNVCGNRVKMARFAHNPPLTQENIARLINLQGMEMTPLIISRIERNQRHVCDGELHMISMALSVSMEWLCCSSDS